MRTITVEIGYDDEDGMVEHTFPAKLEVCSECDGEGFVLVDGMRGHCYTQEEFNESFSEDDAREYFTRGGKYDQVCPCCKGRNVVEVIDRDSCATGEHAVAFKAYKDFCEERWQSAQADAKTYQMESGMMG